MVEALRRYVQEFKDELNLMEEDEDEEDMKIDKEKLIVNEASSPTKIPSYYNNHNSSIASIAGDHRESSPSPVIIHSIKLNRITLLLEQ